MISTSNTGEPQSVGGNLPTRMTSRALILSVVFIIIALGTILTVWTAIQTDRMMRDELLIDARIGFAGINITDVSGLTGSSADLTAPVYREMKEQLSEIRSADPHLRFAYLIGRRSDGTYFFFVDSEPPESADYSPPGQDYPEVTPLIISVFTRGDALTEGPASDRWGTWVSAIVPVDDPETGRRIAVFGIDQDATDWFWQIAGVCLTPVAVTLLVLAMVLSFFFIQQRNERERLNLEISRQVLRESEERYRLLFSQSPLGILHLDTGGVIINANRKLADIVGISPRELIGFNSLERIPNPGLLTAIRQALDGDAGFFEGEDRSVITGSRSALRVVCQPVGLQDHRFSGIICIVEDITERWVAEQKEKQQNAFFIKTQQALMQLSRLPAGDLQDYFSRITATDATTLQVSRVSIWWFSSDLSELVCAGGFGCGRAPENGPARLKRTDYPRYFRALDENRIIAAPDARADERTAEFTESYLIPLGITSMLDIPIRRGDRVAGILCHEHTGEMRAWSPLEQDFAAAVADFISAADRTDRADGSRKRSPGERTAVPERCRGPDGTDNPLPAGWNARVRERCVLPVLPSGPEPDHRRKILPACARRGPCTLQ